MEKLTVKCTNKECNKEYVSEFHNCPFCGTKNPKYDDDKLELNNGEESKKSYWWYFSAVVLIIAFGFFVRSIYSSIKYDSFEMFVNGLQVFLITAFLCALIQLLAEINHGIANLKNK